MLALVGLHLPDILPLELEILLGCWLSTITYEAVSNQEQGIDPGVEWHGDLHHQIANCTRVRIAHREADTLALGVRAVPAPLTDLYKLS